jgi:hypothetical protein
MAAQNAKIVRHHILSIEEKYIWYFIYEKND